jgi:hypothetical protein
MPRQRNNRRQRAATILLPRRDGSGWTWDELEIKKSTEKNAGNGLFAKTALEAGTVIPHIGKPTTKRGTHIFAGKDGNPNLNPYNGIGNNGLSIAMMVNESQRKKPRVKFTRGHMVTTRKIKAGEELFGYYGNDYDRAYPMNNPYLESPFPELEKVNTPTGKEIDTAVAATIKPKFSFKQSIATLKQQIAAQKKQEAQLQQFL